MNTDGSRAHLQIAALSDTGRVRGANQDYAHGGPLPGAEGWQLLAVADGLGGHARGEWASERTIELLVPALASGLACSDPLTALSEAVTSVNAVVYREANEQGFTGAATTLVVAVVRGDEAWWLNVGDSRLYLWSGGALRQVSADHSWVADQVRAGLLPADAVHQHKNRNVVTRTVGFEATVTAETGGPIRLANGDALLLCSDGLHGPVRDQEIARTVAALTPERAVTRLVELANAAGGPDNITVVIGQMGRPLAPAVEEEAASMPGAAEEPRKRSWRRWGRLRFSLRPDGAS